MCFRTCDFILKGDRVNIEENTLFDEKETIKKMTDDIYEVRKKINLHRERLENAWKSNEVSGIIFALDELCDELKCIEYDLEDLIH